MSEVEEVAKQISNLNLNFLTPLTDSASGIKLEESKETSAMSQFKPEYLNCVPTFDGNPNDLNRYITICQSLIDNFYDQTNPTNFQNTYLINSLISKLTGNAKLVINIQNVNRWEDLKNVLQRNFADQRDETCLNRDLVLMKQLPQEKPFEFYDRILHILNLLCSYVDSHENLVQSRTLKRNLYNDLALKTFLSGLREPLGTTIRCMRPINLAQALQFVTQENNTHYFQNQPRSGPMFQQGHTNRPRPTFPKSFPNVQPSINSFRPTLSNSFPNVQPPMNSFRPTFPSSVNTRPNFNRQGPRTFTNSQIIRRPNGQSNVFRPNPFRQLPPPTPMSGISESVQRPLPYNSASNPKYQPPKYTVEELYSTEAQNLSTLGQNEEEYEYNQYSPFEEQYSDQTGYYQDDNTQLTELNVHDKTNGEINPYQAQMNQEKNFSEKPRKTRKK